MSRAVVLIGKLQQSPYEQRSRKRTLFSELRAANLPAAVTPTDASKLIRLAHGGYIDRRWFGSPVCRTYASEPRRSPGKALLDSYSNGLQDGKDSTARTSARR